MKKIILFIITFIQILSANAENLTIKFTVDMSKSSFKPIKSVGLRGSIAPLSWDKSFPLTDENNDGIFEGSITFSTASNTIIEYKYLCNEKWENTGNRTIKAKNDITENNAWEKIILSKNGNPYTFIMQGQEYSFNQRMHSEQTVHGVSQILIKNGKVDTMLSYGFRDVENSLPVDANTLFHIGGMGVSITAFALLRASEKGLLDLDQPLNNYLKTWKLESNTPYTVRDLMMGKIRFNTEKKPYGYVAGKKIPTLLQLLNGEKPATLPKTKVLQNDNKSANFSISAALIGQQILEDVYQKSFADIIEMEILKPLKMTQTIVSQSLTNEQLQNASVGYLKNGKAVTGNRMIFPELGFGGIWTTTQDYAKFITYLMLAARGEDNTLLSQKSAKAAVESNGDYRALVFPRGDHNYLGGAATGFRTQTTFDVEQNWLMVTFVNSWENWRVMLELERAGRQKLEVN
jgi:CubicO group peptidase (beta-lactamase class C family)